MLSTRIVPCTETWVKTKNQPPRPFWRSYPSSKEKKKEAIEWRKIYIVTERMKEDLHCYWKNEGTGKIFVRLMKSLTVLSFCLDLCLKNTIFLFSQGKAKKEYVHTISPSKNMSTSEFSRCSKCKPLLLLFCSHNYFSNQQYLHVVKLYSLG